MPYGAGLNWLRLSELLEGNGWHLPGSAVSRAFPSAALIRRRVFAVRSANAEGRRIATIRLRQRLEDLDINDVLDSLMEEVETLSMYVAVAVLGGGTVGAIGGSFAGGVGAGPGFMGGAALGLRTAGAALGVFGLVELAGDLAEKLPHIAKLYVQASWQAYNSISEDSHLLGHYHTRLIDDGSLQFGLAHEEAVMLLLSAVVAYLLRERGNLNGLASKLQTTQRGKRIAQWVAKHQEALLAHPALQPRRPLFAMAEAPRTQVPPPRQTPGTQPNDRHAPRGRQYRRAPRHQVPCFNAYRLPKKKIHEFDRQLKGQERGLNDLTVQEYLDGRALFGAGEVRRNGAIAKRERRDFSEKLRKESAEHMVDEGMDWEEANILAEKIAERKMRNFAALHNPDMIAGGKDVISGFGDRQVNATIGPQWKSRLDGLDKIANEVPESLRDVTRINAALTRCH